MKNIINACLLSCSIIVAVSLTSCEMADFELSKSVFIEDYDYPGLPIYSEWGYNTFGMYIDRGVFVSSGDVFPAKIIVNPDTFNITFSGRYNYNPASLRISVIGYVPIDYPELVKLNDSILDLKASNCIVTLKYGNESKKLNIIQGNIKFKRVQNLFVDKEFAKTILSGTIEFKTFLNNEPVAITNGRFDLGIGYENFYYY
ncbi:MAG: hypothetical protein PHQ11_06330 [Paludibacter sp.]|nr:hypothetical protein [Paludibacter sp.]